MLSIHNNLSAGAQNVKGAYIIIVFVNRRLLTALTWQSSCVIANNAQKTPTLLILSKAIISKFTM